jgi:transcriptional regulator with XRE-family HTH domain
MKNRMRELRKEKDMTSEELGKILGVSGRTILRYETGEREPDTTDTLIKIAEYFNVSIDYLLYQTDIRDNSRNVPLKDIITEENKHVIPEGFALDDKYIGILKDYKEQITPEELKLIIEYYIKLKGVSPPDTPPTNNIKK